MSDIVLCSDITVSLVQSVGSDRIIVAAMQASTKGVGASGFVDSLTDDEVFGRIRYLMKNRHTSPFEHGLMTFAVHAPAMAWWEWVRHRFQAVDCPGLSFNLESARYRELEPVFWVPRRERPMFCPPGFKPSRPRLVEAGTGPYAAVRAAIAQTCNEAWEIYAAMIRDCIAPEVARSVLPFNTYYHGWASGNPLAWMHFLSKRTADAGAAVPSYPQSEIEEAARQVEDAFKAGWPLTWRAWNDCGRVAP